MKKSIKSLPKCTQNELAVLQELILKHLSKVAMVILFGSYAKKKYVIWDEYVEDGIRYSYQSDLDILLIVESKHFKYANQKVSNKIIPEYNKRMEECSKRHAPARIIVETIGFVNKNLKVKQYFFSDIVKEGIMLYDNKLFELAKPKELTNTEIYKISLDYYDDTFPFAEDFLDQCRYAHSKEKYVLGSFELHQSCENFYNAIELVYTHYRTKCHKLEDLGQAMCRYSLELKSAFPRTNEFEINCFKLLCDAYIKARYNRHFRVTKEELEYLIQRVEILKDLTEQICKTHLSFLKEVIENE